jgi:hypothetical protein
MIRSPNGTKKMSWNEEAGDLMTKKIIIKKEDFVSSSKINYHFWGPPLE